MYVSLEEYMHSFINYRYIPPDQILLMFSGLNSIATVNALNGQPF